MIHQADAAATLLSNALSASGFVGTWEHDLVSGNVVLDGGAAEILLGDQDFAGHSITLGQTLSGLHPDDRDWVRPEIDEFARVGGIFSAEYRVRSPAGKTRRLLDLGQSVKQADGLRHGFGVLIDITDRPVHFMRTAAAPLTEPNVLEALAVLENRALGSASFRTRVLLQMLRLEIESQRI
ncbi:PAS domain-containing protein [Methylobacterium brachythecii]|uniref:PAS fold-3 domain-containing protein n=1 Tax=Methylobacterium brachythecii TaxID=1176177 RepID=A0A7W6AJV2_9HYPH|nr:PAS domain-containing protein [Methylobacterium brachythecii]MBB3904748.1 hypothetical protein [Methylobacterium brachythecii]GLS45576.1 hypothetical protein GCM10007884_35670 [Methylobacterium brachythecii]